jgi:hypothetical protein
MEVFGSAPAGTPASSPCSHQPVIDEVPHTQHDIVLNMNLQGIPMMEIINRSQKNIVLGDDADDCYAPTK